MIDANNQKPAVIALEKVSFAPILHSRRPLPDYLARRTVSSMSKGSISLQRCEEEENIRYKGGR